jgi:hypothetical protein
VEEFHNESILLEDPLADPGLKYGSSFNIVPKMNLLDDTFPMGYHTPKTEIVCKSYDPKKLMY